MPRRYVSGRGLLMFQKVAFLSVRLEARGVAAPRERATGRPHLPSRRLHLRVRLLARLLEAPRRATGPLPKADQELSRRVTPADSGREAARFKLMCSFAQVSLTGELRQLSEHVV